MDSISSPSLSLLVAAEKSYDHTLVVARYLQHLSMCNSFDRREDEPYRYFLCFLLCVCHV